MSTLVAAFTVVAVAAGAFFFLAGSVGLLRFPDAASRVHALTKADNLGLGLIVLGLLPHAGGVLAGAKLIAAWLLAQLTATAVAQLFAATATHGRPR